MVYGMVPVCVATVLSQLQKWEDIRAIESQITVHAIICALAVHGLVANPEFKALWNTADPGWRVRNTKVPYIKTGRVGSRDFHKQRIRLAEYLGIVVPPDVLGPSHGVPPEIGTIGEDLSAEAMIRMLTDKGLSGEQVAAMMARQEATATPQNADQNQEA